MNINPRSEQTERLSKNGHSQTNTLEWSHGTNTASAFSVCCLFYSGFTSLSTIFQSYRDGVWMWQGAQCSFLECCRTEISRPDTRHDIPPSHIILTLS